MNEVLKNIKERRSIRKYKAEQITDEQLNAILDAATYSASGMNRQPVKLVAIQDAKTIAELSKMNAAVMGRDIDPFYGAPTVVLVLSDKAAGTFLEDGVLAMGNLMNAAHSVGVDSCWIHRAKEVFESEAGKALLAKWGIQGDYQGIGHCILGYRDCEYPEAAPRKEDMIVRI